MLIKRTSQLTGIERELDIPVEREHLDAWANGMLIQQAMPYINTDDREFIMTGITSDEWDKAFGEGA